MILALIQQVDTADELLKSASCLAVQLEKKLGILLINVQKKEWVPEEESLLKSRIDFLQLFLQPVQIFRASTPQELTEMCEKVEASFLFIQ